MTSGSRAAFADAGAAFRAAHDRARAVSADLTKGDLAVLLAVGVLLTSYSRTEDRISRRQVAAAAGVHEQTAGRSLTHLDRLGVLSWTPATHRGGTSCVSLAPSPDTTVVSSEAVEPDTAVVSSPDTAAVPHPRRSFREEDGGGAREDEDEEDDGYDAMCFAAALADALGIEDRLTSIDRRSLIVAIREVPAVDRGAVLAGASARRPPRKVHDPIALALRRVDDGRAAVHRDRQGEAAVWPDRGAASW